MNLLVWAILLISGMFIIMLLWWRVYLPKRQTKTYLIFAFLWTLCWCVVFNCTSLSVFGFAAPSGFGEIARIALLMASVILAFMITYSAIEADSPSLVMVLKINGAGKQGLDKEEFNGYMNDSVLIKPRVDDLLLDKMAVFRNGKYTLTAKGRFMTQIFIFYRSLMGLKKGG